MTTKSKYLWEIVQEVAVELKLPEYVRVTETRTLDPTRPSIYINNHRIVGGKPSIGQNTIRERRARSIDILQTIPADSLRQIHNALGLNS